jgi:hypothetical protein
LLDENYPIDVSAIKNKNSKEDERKTYESIMKRVNTNKKVTAKDDGDQEDTKPLS